MLVAGLSFAFMNISIKFITHLSIFQVVMARVIITLLVSFIVIKKFKKSIKGFNTKALILRGFYGSLGLICYIYTLQNMYLATAIVIHYLSPIFTTLIAYIQFNEKIKPTQWWCFIITFIGVLVVKGFSEVSLFNFLIGVLGAIFTGLAYNSIKSMKGKEDPDVIVFYHPLITLPIIIIYALIFPQSYVVPTKFDYVFLIGTGVFTQIGQYFITRAYQLDNAARISSVTYIGLIWGVLFGVILFGESYSILSFMGMILVLLGVIMNLNFQYLSKK